MPRTVSFNGVTQQFPDDATDDEIRSALEASNKPPEKTLAGFGSNVLTSGKKFIGDIASGVSDLAGKGVQAVLDPGGAIKDLSESHPIDAAVRVKDFYKHRYGFDKPTLKEGLQQAADTLYEDPVGVASDVATVATGVGGAAKGAAKLAGLSRVPMAASLANAGETVARGAGAVAEATNPLNVTKVPWAAARSDYPWKLAGKENPINNALNAKGEKLYAESLKIPPGGTFTLPEREAMIDEGLRKSKVPADVGGYKKLNAGIQDIEDTVNPGIAASAARGDTVDPLSVARRVDDVRDKFKTVTPKAHRDTLNRVQDEFLDEHRNPIPTDEAIDIKRNTYRDQGETAYGSQGTSEVEGQKALARGLKEEAYDKLRDLVPGIDQLGQREKVMIDLRDAFERFIAREGNKQTVPLAAAAAHSSPSLALAIKFLDSAPDIKSRIAIALANRGGPPGSIISKTNTLKMVGPPAATIGKQQQ